MIALHLRDAFITLALPVGNWIHLVPCVEQLRLLTRECQVVLVTHIEVGARNGTACTRWWLGNFFFEIDLHGALTVLAFTAIPLAVHKVAAIAIHLTD